MATITATPAKTGTSALRIAKIIGGGLIGIAFGLTLGAVIVGILATQFFGFHLVRVSSASMEPELSVGDVIVVRPASQNDIETGDIIMFTQGVDEIPTVHRVIGENKINTVLKGQDGAEDTTYTTKRFVTKGDANERPDTTEVTGDALKGELWFTVPGLGGTSGMPLQTVLLLIAGCLGAGWVCYEIYHRLGRAEKASADAGGSGDA